MSDQQVAYGALPEQDHWRLWLDSDVSGSVLGFRDPSFSDMSNVAEAAATAGRWGGDRAG